MFCDKVVAEMNHVSSNLPPHRISEGYLSSPVHSCVTCYSLYVVYLYKISPHYAPSFISSLLEGTCHCHIDIRSQLVKIIVRLNTMDDRIKEETVARSDNEQTLALLLPLMKAHCSSSSNRARKNNYIRNLYIKFDRKGEPHPRHGKKAREESGRLQQAREKHNA